MIEPKPNWTPIRRGEYYCSPSCGCNCTLAEYELANMRAERLAARMNQQQGGFSDWSVRVWENDGWQYEIIRDVHMEGETMRTRNICDITETLNEDGEPLKYTCIVCVHGRQFIHEGGTPEAALINTMESIRTFQRAFEISFARFKAVL